MNLEAMDAPALRARIVELEAQLAAKRRPKSKAVDLTMRLSPAKRSSKSATVVCYWADGTQTRQTVSWNKNAERWPAAFQACDRLRRIRTAGEVDWREAMRPLRCAGVEMAPPAYWRFLAARPMPALVSISDEDTGEDFVPDRDYGMGDAREADHLWLEAQEESAEYWRPFERAWRQTEAAWEAYLAQLVAS